MGDATKWGTHSSIPWREWHLFKNYISNNQATLHTIGKISWSSGNNLNDWDGNHIDFCYMGMDQLAGAYDAYYALFKPSENSFKVENQIDTLLTVGATFHIHEKDLTGSTAVSFIGRFTFMTEVELINFLKVEGKHYNGVNFWTNTPPNKFAGYQGYAKIGANIAAVVIADLPCEYHSYIWAKQAGGDLIFDRGNPVYADNPELMFNNGFALETATYTGAGAGQRHLFTVIPDCVRALYMNGIVNNLSRYKMRTDGGIQLELNGLGFSIPQADLADYCNTPTDFQHHVEKIHFIGREGQGNYIVDYHGGTPAKEFDQTNTKITIPTMPAMAKGTYFIRLEQEDKEHGNADSDHYFTYAGDWRSNADARIREGTRIVFLVTDENIPKEPVQPFFEWGWKWGDLEIDEHYAPVDTRATKTFWDGLVQGVSSLSRSVDDKTGLYSISDVSIELANQTKHFSKLLANYFCKGQVASIAHGRGEEPEAWHESIFYGVIDDYNLKGPSFNAKLKDYAQKFMKGQLPAYMITREEYPDCKDAANSQYIPELIGRHYYDSGESPGAIQAHCIDENNFIYICSRGPLHAILNVFADGVLVNPANYAAFIDVDGRQYIQFSLDQGDKKITFNCEGYMFAGWNSANGYIQNPAYVIAFYWAMLLEIPIDFIDLDAINDLADLFDNLGAGEIGKLFIVSSREKSAIFQDLLFSFGVKYWQKKDGLLTLGRKDIANISSDLFIHAQVEIMEYPDRAFNLETALNSIKGKYDKYPAADLYGGAIEENDASSIERFGEVYQDEWNYPFITSEDFCRQRIIEDLYKISYGDKYVKFQLPIEMIGDIEIFDDFKLQDPYGLSATGSGEISREYYVTGLTYDYQNATIEVIAVDLQWLLQQYFIFGDEDEMPDFWEDASDYYRLYGYLCDEDTFAFSDGIRGKILIDENLVDQD